MIEVVSSGKKKGQEVNKGWTCDLVPKSQIVARYFADEQAEIERLQSELEAVSAAQAELEEEHSGEEGLLSELEKINKQTVNARLKEIKQSEPPGASGRVSEYAEEAKLLRQWIKQADEEAALKKQIKEADAARDEAAYARYPTLTEDEVKTLVVDDKWLARLDADIHGEMDRISQLTQRVKELAERYETPLPQLSDRVADLEAKVNGHLERMGFGSTTK